MIKVIILKWIWKVGKLNKWWQANLQTTIALQIENSNYFIYVHFYLVNVKHTLLNVLKMLLKEVKYWLLYSFSYSTLWNIKHYYQVKHGTNLLLEWFASSPLDAINCSFFISMLRLGKIRLGWVRLD
jgi:hypothetical protein